MQNSQIFCDTTGQGLFLFRKKLRIPDHLMTTHALSECEQKEREPRKW